MILDGLEVNLGLPGLALMLLVMAVLVAPMWLLLPKFGISKWWSVLAINPAFVFVFVWVLALRDPINTPSEAS